MPAGLFYVDFVTRFREKRMPFSGNTVAIKLTEGSSGIRIDVVYALDFQDFGHKGWIVGI